MKIIKEDIQNLEVIFSLAKQALINANDDQLIQLIAYKRDLISRIKETIEPAEVKTVEETKSE